MRFPTLLAAAAAGAVLAGSGCNTFQHRANQKSEVYNSLPAEAQQRLRQRQIRIGDTQDMVYIALGYPDEVREHATPQGVTTVWIFRTYWQQYEGTAWVGWHRIIVPLRDGRGYAIIHEPVTTDVYQTRIDEVIRVTFSHGVVTSVEQRKQR